MRLREVSKGYAMGASRLHALLEDFSAAARYHNNLSSFNLHLDRRVSIDTFIAEARHLDPGEFAD